VLSNGLCFNFEAHIRNGVLGYTSASRKGHPQHLDTPERHSPLINDTKYYLLKLVVTFVPLRAESLAGPRQSAAYTSYTPLPWIPTIPGS
jgi:hypothetical protein